MAESAIRITTGSLSFEGGVDSNKVQTIAGPTYPNGLKPNQLAWLQNATVRGGGISPRRGWKRLLEMPVTALYQSGSMYLQQDGFPYIIVQIGGRIYQVRVDLENEVVDLSENSGLTNPTDTEKAFFCQGEQFLVIQAGDYYTLPLFWDGAALIRSRGQLTPSTILPNPTFTVPPLYSQSPVQQNLVLASLTAPYAGVTNQILFIGGYRYQQVEPGQHYAVTATVPAASAAAVAGARLVLPTGTLMNVVASGYAQGATATLITPEISLEFDGGNSSIGVDLTFSYYGQTQIIFKETDISSVPYSMVFPGLFRLAAVTFSNGVVVNDVIVRIFSFPLATPGANEVWLANLDDPRAGTVVSPASAAQDTYSQLPAAGPMDYYMGRIWSANGQEYLAGDIVGGPSGSGRYNLKDSILYITENDYLALGGAFSVPSNSGRIRALKHPANIDTALGEGQLLVFTSNTIFSVNVSPTRAEWQTQAEPVQRVAMINMGTLSDNSVVPVNGDLFFQAEDGVQSFIQAIRYFGQWGNVPISSEEDRVVVLNDRNLLRFGSGILLDNRMLQTCLPEQTDVGVIHKGLMPLDFDLISTLSERFPPSWEGVLEGLDILQVMSADFGGRKRAFAFIRSQLGKIELWEMDQSRIDDENIAGDARITWVVETPAYTWDRLFTLKELDTIEIWVDQLYGDVDFRVYFRPDQHPCWEYWHEWKECAAKNECDLPNASTPCNYPVQEYRKLYRAMMTLPRPRTDCAQSSGRPMNLAYSFQFRIEIKGYCRIRGIKVHGFEKVKSPYVDITC